MAGLPWIKVATDLREHEKTLRLCAMLNDRRGWSWVVGLWMWAAEQQADGHVRGPEALAMIEFGAGWDSVPGQLGQALLRCGLLTEDGEGGYLIHDWWEWQAAHVERKSKDAERKAKWRSKRKEMAGTRVPLSRGTCPVGHAGHAGQNGTNSSESRDQRVEREANYLSAATSAAAPEPTPEALSLLPQTPAVAAAETTAPKPKRPPTAKPTDDRFAPVRAAWEAEFLAATGAPYYWGGAADAAGVHRVIAVDLEEFRERARRGLRAQGFDRCATLAELTSNAKWNRLVGTPGAPKPPVTAPASPQAKHVGGRLAI